MMMTMMIINITIMIMIHIKIHRKIVSVANKQESDLLRLAISFGDSIHDEITSVYKQLGEESVKSITTTTTTTTTL